MGDYQVLYSQDLSNCTTRTRLFSLSLSQDLKMAATIWLTVLDPSWFVLTEFK